MVTAVTAVELPEEPPVGTELTAPRMDNTYRRTDRGWYVVGPLGSVMFPDLPGASWASVVHNLTVFGGIVTVTTEYEVEIRVDRPGSPGTFREIYESRESALIGWPDGLPVIGLRSRQVTRSEWRDEPLEEPS